MKCLPISGALALGTALFATQAYSYTNPQSNSAFSSIRLDNIGLNLNKLPDDLRYDGVYLFRGQYLTAPYCRYILEMQQSDGNLVLYGNTNFSQADWWTSTQGTNSQFAGLAGANGNFLVASISGTGGIITWSSNSGYMGAMDLEMQSDGNLASYIAYMDPSDLVWQSGTSNRYPPNSPSYCIVRSEATYYKVNYMFNGDAISQTTQSSVYACASACVNDRTDPCTAFTWYSPTKQCFLRHSYTSAYPESAYGAISGFIRGRKAQGE